MSCLNKQQGTTGKGRSLEHWTQWDDAALQKKEEKRNDLASSKKNLKQSNTGNGVGCRSSQTPPKTSKGALRYGQGLGAGSVEVLALSSSRGGNPGKATQKAELKDRACLQQRTETKIDTLTLYCHSSSDWPRDIPKATARSQHPHEMYLSFFREKKRNMLIHLVRAWRVASHFHTLRSVTKEDWLACTGDTAHPPTEMEKVLNKKWLEHSSAPQAAWWILGPWLSPSVGSFSDLPQVILRNIIRKVREGNTICKCVPREESML